MGVQGLQLVDVGGIEGLRALQLERLRQTLSHAYERVPYYRAAFDAAGLRPEDLADLGDLSRFPFTTKAALRDNYPFGLFAVPMAEIARMHASSGTTGKPTVVGYTRADMDVWADLMARAFQATGARPGDIVHNAIPYGLFTGGLGWHAGAERFGVAVVPASGGATERHVQLITDLRPDILAGDALLHAGDRRRAGGARHRARANAACGSPCSAPSRARRRCAARSRSASAWRPTIPTACRS